MASLKIAEADGKHARYPKLYVNLNVMVPRIKEVAAQLRISSDDIFNETFEGIGAMSRTACRGDVIMEASEEMSNNARNHMEVSHADLKENAESGRVRDLIEDCISKVQTALAVRETSEEARQRALAAQSEVLSKEAQAYSDACQTLLENSDREMAEQLKKLEKQWTYTPVSAATE
eukprot:TRINITY_DN21426_c0_g1_i1.p1 TRINITY_DN21426_c0_g1~~TRINITY_DN21426_c0_g1_i1.p1  ORF type:complete len:194 (+),score=48.87 TRINITY_DN21426_c0_g1_i1:57-584(+)